MQPSVTESDRDRSNDSAALPRAMSVEPKMAMKAFWVKQSTFSKLDLSLPYHHVYNPIALHSLSEWSFWSFSLKLFPPWPALNWPLAPPATVRAQLCGWKYFQTPLAVRPTKPCDNVFNIFHKNNDIYWSHDSIQLLSGFSKGLCS